MLISTSELFWVGLVQGTLAAPSIEPPDNDGMWELESVPTLYHTIIQFADLCGLGQSPIQHQGDEQECILDLAELHWGYQGEIISSTAVQEGREILAGFIEATRIGLLKGNPSGAVATRFDELLEERSPILFGYSSQTPDKLYGMKKSGRVVVAARIEPMPPGILQVLLRLLASYLDTPPIAFMALAATGDVSPGWHSTWIPSGWTLEQPLQAANPAAAMEAIERELIGPMREDQASRLGLQVATALRTLKALTDWLQMELYLLDRASLSVRMLDFTPAKTSDEFEATDEPADGDDATWTEHDADDTEGDCWSNEIHEVVRSACIQVGYGAADPPSANQDVLRLVKAVRRDLKHAASVASQLQIDTIIPSLNAGVKLADALLNEDAACDGTTKGTWYVRKMEHRQNLLNYSDTLQGVIPLAFGELRLRELLHDAPSQGLDAPSLRGWARLVENARAGVREGFALHKQGYRPYVIINVVQATLETIVTALVEKHLSACSGADLGSMLHALHKHATAANDDELRAIASVGLALRLPRNNAVHDSDRTYDKHDAAFFLNGLAIMMRGLA